VFCSARRFVCERVRNRCTAWPANCPNGSPCQLANSLLSNLFESIDLQGRTVFIDQQSFAKIDRVFDTHIDVTQVGSLLTVPFRTDVDSAGMHVPAPQHSPRWRTDPYVLRVDSVTRDGSRVNAYMTVAFNIRMENPDASAVFGTDSQGVNVMALRGGRWEFVESRRVGPIR
jgi:hypothetical protein